MANLTCVSLERPTCLTLSNESIAGWVVPAPMILAGVVIGTNGIFPWHDAITEIQLRADFGEIFETGAALR